MSGDDDEHKKFDTSEVTPTWKRLRPDLKDADEANEELRRTFFSGMSIEKRLELMIKEVLDLRSRVSLAEGVIAEINALITSQQILQQSKESK